MESGQLFDPDGRVLRDEALERVEKNTDPGWRDAARLAINIAAASWARFSADDVAGILDSHFPEAETHDPRAMGAIFQWARRVGLIEPTPDFHSTIRPSGHAGPRRIWRSLVS